MGLASHFMDFGCDGGQHVLTEFLGLCSAQRRRSIHLKVVNKLAR